MMSLTFDEKEFIYDAKEAPGANPIYTKMVFSIGPGADSVKNF
jgi:hypothetical protein